MTPELKEDILKLIKDELRIDLDTYRGYQGDTEVRVTMYLSGAIMHESSVEVKEGE